MSMNLCYLVDTKIGSGQSVFGINGAAAADAHLAGVHGTVGSLRGAKKLFLFFSVAMPVNLAAVAKAAVAIVIARLWLHIFIARV